MVSSLVDSIDVIAEFSYPSDLPKTKALLEDILKQNETRRDINQDKIKRFDSYKSSTAISDNGNVYFMNSDGTFLASRLKNSAIIFKLNHDPWTENSDYYLYTNIDTLVDRKNRVVIIDRDMINSIIINGSLPYGRILLDHFYLAQVSDYVDM